MVKNNLKARKRKRLAKKTIMEKVFIGFMSVMIILSCSFLLMEVIDLISSKI